MIDWTSIIILSVILATGVEIIHFLVDMYIIKHIKSKDKIIHKIKIISSFIITLIIISTIFSGFYTTATNEHTVLNKITGKRIIVKEVGIHYSILSTRQTIDLREQFMTFPEGERFQESDMILTRDRIPIRVSGIFNYKVINSEEWALKIKDPDNQLFYKLNSIIIETVKKTNYGDLTINREIIEKEIFDKIEQQGIEKISFKFIKTADSLDVVSAKTKAEANEIKAKSLIEQAQSEAQSYKILQDSLKDYTPQQIEYLKTKLLSENINVKWVVPYGTSTIINEN